MWKVNPPSQKRWGRECSTVRSYIYITVLRKKKKKMARKWQEKHQNFSVKAEFSKSLFLVFFCTFDVVALPQYTQLSATRQESSASFNFFFFPPTTLSLFSQVGVLVKSCRTRFCLFVCCKQSLLFFILSLLFKILHPIASFSLKVNLSCDLVPSCDQWGVNAKKKCFMTLLPHTSITIRYLRCLLRVSQFGVVFGRFFLPTFCLPMITFCDVRGSRTDRLFVSNQVLCCSSYFCTLHLKLYFMMPEMCPHTSTQGTSPSYTLKKFVFCLLNQVSERKTTPVFHNQLLNFPTAAGNESITMKLCFSYFSNLSFDRVTFCKKANFPLGSTVFSTFLHRIRLPI